MREFTWGGAKEGTTNEEWPLSLPTEKDIAKSCCQVQLISAWPEPSMVMLALQAEALCCGPLLATGVGKL